LDAGTSNWGFQHLSLNAEKLDAKSGSIQPLASPATQYFEAPSRAGPAAGNNISGEISEIIEFISDRRSLYLAPLRPSFSKRSSDLDPQAQSPHSGAEVQSGRREGTKQAEGRRS
jgi:hypothetical protein